MLRYIQIRLEKRRVVCVARLLDDEAPDTCELIWNELPQAGDIFHAKYASNEIYILRPPLQGQDPGLENSTVVPARGEVVYFHFPAGMLPHSTRRELGLVTPTFVDLAVFYGRNNFLFNPGTGFTHGNVFATIEENLDGMASACQDVFRAGQMDERLIFERQP